MDDQREPRLVPCKLCSVLNIPCQPSPHHELHAGLVAQGNLFHAVQLAHEAVVTQHICKDRPIVSTVSHRNQPFQKRRHEFRKILYFIIKGVQQYLTIIQATRGLSKRCCMLLDKHAACEARCRKIRNALGTLRSDRPRHQWPQERQHRAQLVPW